MLKHVLFVALLVFVLIGYLVQINIIKRIVDLPYYGDGALHIKLQEQMTTSLQQHQKQERPQTDDPFILAHSARQEKQLLRTRMTEEQVHHDLKSAFSPVAPLVQGPLGGAKPENFASYMFDNHLRPLDANFRSMDVVNNPALRAARVIYLITPTYKRTTQMVDLLRISQTLQLVVDGGYHVRLYWIILEDHAHCTNRVRQLVLDSGIPFAHVNAKSSSKTNDKKYNPFRHRGVEQRNAGLQIVEQVGAEGVVYFMDDDNAYHVQLFHELAYTTHVSVFGVGMPGGSAYERCHVNPATGKVDQLLTTWEAPRRFPMDMAGFAFATHHLARGVKANKPIRFQMKSKSGYLENDLIEQMASTLEELEPLAANCTRILTYHVKTVGNNLYKNPEPNKDAAKFQLLTALV